MNSLYYTPPIENAYIGHILKEIYQDRVYHPFMVGAEHQVIVDIGANIGLTAQYFSQFAQHVYAVEPAKQHFECLQKMVKDNKLKNVHPHKYAVGKDSGTLKLHHNQNVTMFSLNQAVSSGEAEEVDVLDMEALFDKLKIEHCDFMKLDVEGVEMEIVGGEAFQRVADKIDTIMVEYHTWSNRNPGQLVQALEQCGFKVGTMATDATLYVGTR